MGNILENVWGLLCFCAAQLLVNASLYDVKYLSVFVQYKTIKWASAQRKFNNPRMFLCCQTRKIYPAKLSVYSIIGLPLNKTCTLPFILIVQKHLICTLQIAEHVQRCHREHSNSWKPPARERSDRGGGGGGCGDFLFFNVELCVLVHTSEGIFTYFYTLFLCLLSIGYLLSYCNKKN